MRLVKYALSLLLIACILIPSISLSAAEIDATDEAKEYTDICVFSTTEGSASKLQDNNFRTKLEFKSGGTVTLECEEDIYSLYVIWDNIPGVWRLQAESTPYSCGQHGFIHEYIRCRGASTLTIEVPEGATICDVRVFGKGKAPRDVQIWSDPCEKADLLLIPSHADDEHLYFGGTMPYYAGELGYAVQVAYFTNHWAEPRRPHELLNGLWTVGITHYPVISPYPDKATFDLESAKKIYNEEEMLGYIVELMRRFKPDVVIGHDLKGEYGHGAHMLSAELICRAVDGVVQDENMYPVSAAKYGVWDVPKTYIHKLADNAIYMDWDKPLENFGGRTAFEMAKEGYACHVSQHGFDIAVTKYGTASCIWFGLYRSTVGPDTLEDPDFLENIPKKEETTEPETTLPEETEPETTEQESTEADVTEPGTTIAPVTETSPSESEDHGQSTSAAETDGDGGRGENGASALWLIPVILIALLPVMIIIFKRSRG